MKFVVLTDKGAIYEEVRELILSIEGAECDWVKGTDLLGMKYGIEFDVFVVDVKTWSRHYSMYKYFGVLDVIDEGPYIIVSRSKSIDFAKGRLGKKDSFCVLPSSTDNFQKCYETQRKTREKLDLLKAVMK